MRKILLWGFIASLIFAASPALAQSCAALIDAVYAQAALECETVLPGEACYASSPVTTPGLTDESFAQPGDSMIGVQALQTGAFDLEAGEWGVAIVSVPTNQPDESITMIVLGDVLLDNASAEAAPVIAVPVRVTFPGGTFLRAEPSAEAAQVAPLVVGQIVPATGKLADGSWFRLSLEDGSSGWVRADLIDVDGDFTILPDVSVDDAAPGSLFGPLQAFDFASGISSAPCSDVPDSGLLVQAPGAVTLRVNGADIQFAGTVFLQARRQRELIVNVLDDTAQVTSGGVTETASVGNRIRVPYDADGERLAAPRAPQPYLYGRLSSLPFGLLPRPVVDLPVNLLNLVTPAAPDGTLLEGITAESVCTVGAVNEVRLRQGPGTDYPITGALYAGEQANPNARAEASDGVIWWRLVQGVWVSADVVAAAGSCTATLPLIDAPPVPTMIPPN